MTTGFIYLNDAGSNRQWLLRGDHVCAAEVRRNDGVVMLHMLNGEEILLTHEESKQFVQHARPQNAEVRQGNGTGERVGT